MAQGRLNLTDPPIEDLLDKVDSKFTLVALGALRARQVNAYYNSLGEGLGRVVPPQVASVSGKPLSIAFEEIAASKATYVRVDPDELDAAEDVESVEDGAEEVFGVELLASEDEGVSSDGVGLGPLGVEVALEVDIDEPEVSAELAEDEGPAAG